MILDKIVAEKKKRLSPISSEQREMMQDKALEMKASGGHFYEALRRDGISIIGELKKASPSKGLILESFEESYLEIGETYEREGIRAISVLTEEDFFLGKNAYLESVKEKVSLPVLRKDFIIDTYQIYESKVIGADAILLIVRILTDAELKEFFKVADALGLDVLFEVHGREEIERALEAGAKIIGVNNRDLDTFEVDIKRSKELYPYLPKECVKVSESGIFTGAETIELYESGFDACLIGECLMKSQNLKKDINNLLGK